MAAEAGVHRLVRISPFDQAARRHTSFASVYVWPEMDDDIEIDIPDKDLRIDTYRSSGAGGQHVNVTDSAVRITHLPTGIVVSCQNERSQHKNRDVAMKVLKARLYDLKVKEQQNKLESIGGVKKDIAFGSQIRSYVLQPYQMIKDHRTKYEEGQVHKVLDGDVDPFIKTYLMQKATGTLGAPRRTTTSKHKGHEAPDAAGTVFAALVAGLVASCTSAADSAARLHGPERSARPSTKPSPLLAGQVATAQWKSRIRKKRCADVTIGKIDGSLITTTKNASRTQPAPQLDD